MQIADQWIQIRSHSQSEAWYASLLRPYETDRDAVELAKYFVLETASTRTCFVDGECVAVAIGCTNKKSLMQYN